MYWIRAIAPITIPVVRSTPTKRKTVKGGGALLFCVLVIDGIIMAEALIDAGMIIEPLRSGVGTIIIGTPMVVVKRTVGTSTATKLSKVPRARGELFSFFPFYSEPNDASCMKKGGSIVLRCCWSEEYYCLRCS